MACFFHILGGLPFSEGKYRRSVWEGRGEGLGREEREETVVVYFMLTLRGLASQLPNKYTETCSCSQMSSLSLLLANLSNVNYLISF